MFGLTTAELGAIILTFYLPGILCIDFATVPSPNLDLSALGRVTLAGDFDAISLYKYVGQNESPSSTNGSQSLLTQMPDGAFATLVSSDASIIAMCPFLRKDGSLAGIVIGGNFTSLGGVEAQGAALWDPTSNNIIPLTGLAGSVSAVLCDQQMDTVYVGGDFKGLNSTNAIAWIGMNGWANLPFAGFNGAVNSIVKDSSGKVIFGGSFNGLGNTTAPADKDSQVINLSTAFISAVASTARTGFSDPRNIVCKAGGVDGAGSTWLAADNTPASWEAKFDFGFEPTKVRLWNTHEQGRGTKTWRLYALPDGGIMNFTYVDPVTNQNATCSSTCPLSNDPAVRFQDFHFVNQVGMNSVQISISDWYGSGAGLNGIALFEDGQFLNAFIH